MLLTLLAIVGEIGGFLGLILGVSLLDLKNLEAKIIEDINWKTDNCKLNYINQNITKTVNCSTPWLSSYSR